MKNSTIWLLLASLAVCSAAFDSMTPQLRKEFRELADERMEYMLKNGTPKESHLTMTILLMDCEMATGTPRIWSRWNQLVLEDEACGTQQMAHWCEEKPERQAMVTTWSEKANRTALARFHCRHVNPIDARRSSSPRNRTRILMNCLVAISIFAIIRSWYLSYYRPVPVHPSKILNLSVDPTKSSQSDSFESITFNTSKTRSKSRLAITLNKTNFNNTSMNKFRIIV